MLGFCCMSWQGLGFARQSRFVQTTFVALLLAVFFASVAKADSVLWNTNVNLVAGPDNNRAATPVTSPAITLTTSRSVQGSLSGIVHALETANNPNGFPTTIRMQMTAATNTATDGQTTIFTFSEPVYNLSFVIEDIDGGPAYSGNFNDYVVVSAAGGVLPTSVAITNTANVAYDAALGRFRATSNINISNDQGNASVTFAGPVQVVSVQHLSGPTGGTPTNQWTFIDDLTFTRAPRLAISKAFAPAGTATTFNFTMSNSGTGTTATSVAVPAAGTATVGTFIRLNATNTPTSVTETGPAGWVMSGATANCTDSNNTASGNPAAFTAPIAANSKSFTIASANIVPGATLTCAVTDVKATVRLQKTTNGGPGGPFNFTMSNLSAAASSATTTIAFPTIDATGSPFTVATLGTLVTLTEAVVAGYTSGGAVCTDPNGGPTVSSAGPSITIPGGNIVAGSAYACVFTNHKMPTLQLAKAWGVNNITGNIASIGPTTGGTNNTTAFTANAGTGANSGAAVNIGVGNTIVIPAESFTSGTAANYSTVLACTANGGATANALSGTNGQVSNSLVIGAGDAGKAIVCTYTNTRKSAGLTLRKTWSNGVAGHTATVSSTGFITAATSGPSTSAGNNTTTGSQVTVYAGESGTITESGSNLTSYLQTLACTGTAGLSGNTLTVSPSDTAITCTYTNTLAVPALAVTKTASSGNVPATNVSVTDPLGTVTCPGGNPIPSLAVAASVSCTFSYVVPQAVFNNNGGGDGDIDNTATASGTTAYGTASNSGSSVVLLSGGPGLVLAKQVVFPPGPGGDVNGNGKADPGDIITYRYDVTNSGNRTLTAVTANDTHNAFGAAPAPNNPVILVDVAPLADSTDVTGNNTWDTLAPGDAIRFAWSYTVVQQDVDLLQ